MSIELNHTIVWSRDPEESARFLTEMLGLPEPARMGPFYVASVANGVSLDYMAKRDGEPAMQHYAFIVGEEEFDAILGRIQARGLAYWADPGRSRKGAINHNDGGRGVYWQDPSGHLLEIITRPYGGGAE
jgi:catechol 2,3-dioxygenase-like lactoylglutathione lyase family enzyme